VVRGLCECCGAPAHAPRDAERRPGGVAVGRCRLAMKTMPRGALKVTCSLGATLQASGSGTAIADCAGYLREGSGYLLLPFRRMYGPSRRRTTNRIAGQG